MSNLRRLLNGLQIFMEYESRISIATGNDIIEAAGVPPLMPSEKKTLRNAGWQLVAPGCWELVL